MDGDEVFLDHKPETFEMLLDALRVARTNLAEALGIVVQGQQKFGIVFEDLVKYLGLEWTLGSTHNLPMLDTWLYPSIMINSLHRSWVQ